VASSSTTVVPALTPRSCQTSERCSNPKALLRPRSSAQTCSSSQDLPQLWGLPPASPCLKALHPTRCKCQHRHCWYQLSAACRGADGLFTTKPSIPLPKCPHWLCPLQPSHTEQAQYGPFRNGMDPQAHH